MFEKGINQFEKYYTQQKPNRLLKLRPNLGLVKLTLHFDNNISQQYTCTPLQGAVIAQFHDDDPSKQKSLKLEKLAELLNLTENVDKVKQAASFWK